MARALSPDLRDRVVAAIDGSPGCHAAAARFALSVSRAIRMTDPSRKARIAPAHIAVVSENRVSPWQIWNLFVANIDKRSLRMRASHPGKVPPYLSALTAASALPTCSRQSIALHAMRTVPVLSIT